MSLWREMKYTARDLQVFRWFMATLLATITIAFVLFLVGGLVFLIKWVDAQYGEPWGALTIITPILIAILSCIYYKELE